MKKQLIKRIISAIGIVALAAGLISPTMKGDVAQAASYQWVRTATYHYSPGGKYVSKQNSHYKYDCHYQGTTDDNYVCFLASGGFYHPSDGTKNTLADYYHECSQPADSYAPGETVMLTTRYYTKNSSQYHYNGVMELFMRQYDGTKTGDKYFNSSNVAKFLDENNKTYYLQEHPGYTYTEGNTAMIKSKVHSNMPATANVGDSIAIIFWAGTSYDSYSTTYENGYGGSQFFEWIYTYKKVDGTGKKPAAGVVKKIANVKGAYAKVTVKKISGAKKYQVRYRIGKSKKWKTKDGKSNTITFGVKKGTKITVQARVKHATGWGSWGKSKTFTTDKT